MDNTHMCFICLLPNIPKPIKTETPEHAPAEVLGSFAPIAHEPVEVATPEPLRAPRREELPGGGAAGQGRECDQEEQH